MNFKSLKRAIINFKKRAKQNISQNFKKEKRNDLYLHME
jgi:hypothetical protein